MNIMSITMNKILFILTCLLSASPAFAQTTPFSQYVTALGAAGTLGGSERIYALQAGVSRTLTPYQILGLAVGDCTITAPPTLVCTKSTGAFIVNGILTVTSNIVGSGTLSTTGNATINNSILGGGNLTGGTAAASTLMLQGTNNVAPSGDTTTVQGSTVVLRALSGTSTVNVGVAGVTGAIMNFAGGTSGSTALQATGVANGTASLPSLPASGTDTLVARATADTLTNKTISGASNTLTVRLNTADVTATLPYANGGCNATTQVGCTNNIFPAPTRAGDIAYWNGTTWVTLPGNNLGTNVLQQTAAGVPSWVAAGLGTVTSLTCGATVITTTGTCPTIAVVKQTVFTASGTYNPSAGIKYAIIECVGAGAGGGGSNTTDGVSWTSVGSGGGGGSYAKKIAINVYAPQTVSIGSGGGGVSW